MQGGRAHDRGRHQSVTGRDGSWLAARLPTQRNEFGKEGPYDWKFDGNWHCAEWPIDGSTQAYQFFFDGTEVMQMRIMNGCRPHRITTSPDS